jgi:hypothetical protein
MTLDDILARLGALPENEKQEIEAEALKATARRYFVPNVGPQTQAYFSQADEVFYGGGAGGGKSALLCGLAIEEHRKAIIFRREYPQIKSLVDNAAGFFCYSAWFAAEADNRRSPSPRFPGSPAPVRRIRARVLPPASGRSPGHERTGRGR